MSDFTRKIQNTNMVIKSAFIMFICYIGVIRSVPYFYILIMVLSTMILNLVYYMTENKVKIVVQVTNVIFTLYFSWNFIWELCFLSLIYVIEAFIHSKSIMSIYFLCSCWFLYDEKGWTCLMYYTLFFVALYNIYKLENYMINTFSHEKRHSSEKNREVDKLRRDSWIEKECQLQNEHMIKLEEREKLSRELHDKIGHTISGSLMQLEAVKMIMDSNPKKGKAMVDNVTGVLRHGMEDIRRTLKMCKPCEEEIGINKVKNILSEKLKNTGVIHTVDYKGNIEKINISQWNVIYRAVMEGSTNTIKYGKADNIQVDIEVFNKIITCKIKDNGLGCEDIVLGMGLQGIEQAVTDLQGKFLVDGSHGFIMNMIFYLE